MVSFCGQEIENPSPRVKFLGEACGYGAVLRWRDRRVGGPRVKVPVEVEWYPDTLVDFSLLNIFGYLQRFLSVEIKLLGLQIGVDGVVLRSGDRESESKSESARWSAGCRFAVKEQRNLGESASLEWVACTAALNWALGHEDFDKTSERATGHRRMLEGRCN
ncbi:hypothetical protein WN55_04886 [Dufourea novaeangliae]|uniref:Uncharacterized protein n=1 Tax=Dufourea novaeangliae TaxID=178035 RepID=A0A154PMA6_DUFNO|nr:hypothetical protein WN55_04886 [Dufourea novaeangliae]